MKIVKTLPGVTRADLKSFNRCRLFLGVFFVSELTTADGKSITRQSWQGSRERFSPFLWPHQPNPGPKSWRLWRRLLARAFLQEIPKRTTL
jgi:hypothetical protein